MNFSLKRVPAVYQWLLLSLVPLALFLLYTLLVLNGSFAALTVMQEQWLLQRPLAGFDCVVYQWEYLGEAQFNLVLILLLGAVCLLLKYRLRAAFALLLLMGIGLSVEYVGKQYIYQPVPDVVQNGMDALACPQFWRVTGLEHIPLAFGAWWVAPPAPRFQVVAAAEAATAVASTSDVSGYTGYPSGHAYRWMLFGLVACWLAWRQVRRRLLRWLLMAFFLALALMGGFGLFYIGKHLFSDSIGGYLLGAFLSCCAIALLRASETRDRWQHCDLPVLSIAENNDSLLPEKR